MNDAGLNLCSKCKSNYVRRGVEDDHLCYVCLHDQRVLTDDELVCELREDRHFKAAERLTALRAENARLTEALRGNEAKLANVKCQLLDMLDLMPVPGSRWRMNIKTAIRMIDAQEPK